MEIQILQVVPRFFMVETCDKTKVEMVREFLDIIHSNNSAVSWRELQYIQGWYVCGMLYPPE